MKMDEFLQQHAVFTVEELDRFLSARGAGNPNTRRSLLTYYRKRGRIIPIRRGLYATVPVGGDPISSPVDPYLVAAKLTPDAVLAYHTAPWRFTARRTRSTCGCTMCRQANPCR